MTEQPSVMQALSAVMGDVQGIRKGDRNQAQNFNFRGIDAVLNAVGPAFRKHGVAAVPTAVTPTFESYQSAKGAQMRNCTLVVSWRIYGPAGDYLDAQTMGEAADAGDKSVSKAHSVAYRTLLLQALCIPTDEPDPDAVAHERAVTQQSSADERTVLKGRLWQKAQQEGWALGDLRARFEEFSGGIVLEEATIDELRAYLAST